MLDLTGGHGVDLVVETGGATLPQSTVALCTGGAMAMVGYLAGHNTQINVKDLFIGKRARLQGHTVGSREQFNTMNRALEKHRIFPIIDSRFHIDDTERAYERVASGLAFGKVLITI